MNDYDWSPNILANEAEDAREEFAAPPGVNGPGRATYSEPHPAKLVWMPLSTEQIDSDREIQTGRYAILYDRTNLYGTQTNAQGGHFVLLPFDMLTNPIMGTTGGYGPFTTEVCQLHPASDSPRVAPAPPQPSVTDLAMLMSSLAETNPGEYNYDSQPSILDKIKKVFRRKILKRRD